MPKQKHWVGDPDPTLVAQIETGPCVWGELGIGGGPGVVLHLYPLSQTHKYIHEVQLPSTTPPQALFPVNRRSPCTSTPMDTRHEQR